MIPKQIPYSRLNVKQVIKVIKYEKVSIRFALKMIGMSSNLIIGMTAAIMIEESVVVGIDSKHGPRVKSDTTTKILVKNPPNGVRTPEL